MVSTYIHVCDYMWIKLLNVLMVGSVDSTLQGIKLFFCNPLQWRHNGRNSVSIHQPHDCLLNRLFRRRSKKTSKLRVTGLCVGIHRWPVNSPHKWLVTRKMFPFNDVFIGIKLFFCNLQHIATTIHATDALQWRWINLKKYGYINHIIHWKPMILRKWNKTTLCAYCMGHNILFAVGSIFGIVEVSTQGELKYLSIDM